jgi:ABC-type glycerol-3-phosphate transport system substrate-binding protein
MTRGSRRRTAAALAALTLAGMTLAACGGDDEDSGGGATASEEAARAGSDQDVRGSVSITAVWSGDEQKSFQAVLDDFQTRYPNVNVRYTSGGDQLPTVLSTAVAGGNPPDLAVVAQPGLVKNFVAKKALEPITFARDAIEANYSEDWLDQGSVNGQLYGLFFKGANKSTIWYRPQVLSDAGVEPPATYDELIDGAATVNQSGVPAWSIAGADGWTLTDLFENIYLRTAGAEKYDRLSTHDLPWTDPSVTEALTQMKRITGDRRNIAGGVDGALQTDFPTSVTQVFRENPKAAMVIEGDFVPTALPAGGNLEAGTDYDVFDFPSVNGSEPAVMGAGDQVVMFNDSPAARALVTYLATPEAAEVWAERGGFSSPNREVSEDAYSDELTRTTATALANAETFRFDMSDLQPASFGATVGQGMWKIFQDFLRSGNVQQTAQRLEQSATQAYR